MCMCTHTSTHTVRNNKQIETVSHAWREAESGILHDFPLLRGQSEHSFILVISVNDAAATKS